MPRSSRSSSSDTEEESSSLIGSSEEVLDKGDTGLEEELGALDLASYKDAVSFHSGPVSLLSGAAKPARMYGFPKGKPNPHTKEKAWQRYSGERFFRIGRPLKEGAESERWYKKMKAELAKKRHQRKPIDIGGACYRSFIIALVKISSEYDGMPLLLFKVGAHTTIKFNPGELSARQRQHGNFRMDVVGEEFPIKYGEGLIKRLTFDKNVTRQTRRKAKLATIFKSRLRQLKPFTVADVNGFGKVKIAGDYDVTPGSKADYRKNAINAVRTLNGLLMLVMVVEVMQRLYRDAQGQLYDYRASRAAQLSDSLPVASAQARSMTLMASGKITANDFFGKSDTRAGKNPNPYYASLPASHKSHVAGDNHRAVFGFVTDKGVIDHLTAAAYKLAGINDLFNEAILAKSGWEGFEDGYITDNPEGCIISGRNANHQSLIDAYGAGGESSNGDYSDEEDNDLADAVAFTP